MSIIEAAWTDLKRLERTWVISVHMNATKMLRLLSITPFRAVKWWVWSLFLFPQKSGKAWKCLWRLICKQAVWHICLVWVSLFGNADLRKGLLSSSGEVTIDHPQCKSSWWCTNCVCLRRDGGGESSPTGSYLERFSLCCVTHSNECSVFQQASSWRLSCLNWVSGMYFWERDQKAVLSRWILAILGAVMFWNLWVRWRLSNLLWGACGHGSIM